MFSCNMWRVAHRHYVWWKFYLVEFQLSRFSVGVLFHAIGAVWGVRDSKLDKIHHWCERSKQPCNIIHRCERMQSIFAHACVSHRVFWTCYGSAPYTRAAWRHSAKLSLDSVILWKKCATRNAFCKGILASAVGKIMLVSRTLIIN